MANFTFPSPPSAAPAARTTAARPVLNVRRLCLFQLFGVKEKRVLSRWG
ncbi:hypothetical protein N9D57_01605 [bacterium]|nr:hypothetical protein [bacterium]